MNLANKNFILENLFDAVEEVHKAIKRAIDMKIKMSNEEYEIRLNYLCNVLKILTEEDLPKEYEITLNKIRFIDSHESSNISKLIDICAVLIQLGKNIIDNY